jgi:cytidylate kinase
MKKITIALDGYSSCGKSTLAKQLAKHFSYVFIDTGAMYRAVTYFCIQKNLINDKIVDEGQLKSLINNIEISFKINPDTKNNDVYLNGENIEKDIRTIFVSDRVSYVSKVKFVREFLVEQQQKMGESKGVVMDGRDIGTVVFPNAELKIFMTADATVRAERRYKELIEKNIPESFESVKANIIQRDYEDENRDESPLKKAEDARVLDSTNITIEEQFEKAVNWVNEKLEN